VVYCSDFLPTLLLPFSGTVNIGKLSADVGKRSIVERSRGLVEKGRIAVNRYVQVRYARGKGGGGGEEGGVLHSRTDWRKCQQIRAGGEAHARWEGGRIRGRAPCPRKDRREGQMVRASHSTDRCTCVTHASWGVGVGSLGGKGWGLCTPAQPGGKAKG
jgi:hypothetical protein